MSRTFYIQNPEAPKVMSTEELLDLVGGNLDNSPSERTMKTSMRSCKCP